MTKLVAKETLALEGVRVLAGETFAVRHAEDAAVLIARGAAEAAPDPDKADHGAEKRQTKPDAAPVKTK